MNNINYYRLTTNESNNRISKYNIINNEFYNTSYIKFPNTTSNKTDIRNIDFNKFNDSKKGKFYNNFYKFIILNKNNNCNN